jgi:hypothetical protein
MTDKSAVVSGCDVDANVEAMTSKGLRSYALSTDTKLDVSYNVAINH